MGVSYWLEVSASPRRDSLRHGIGHGAEYLWGSADIIAGSLQGAGCEPAITGGCKGIALLPRTGWLIDISLFRILPVKGVEPGHIFA